MYMLFCGSLTLSLCLVTVLSDRFKPLFKHLGLCCAYLLCSPVFTEN